LSLNDQDTSATESASGGGSGVALGPEPHHRLQPQLGRDTHAFNPPRVAASPARGGWRAGPREIPNVPDFYDALLGGESGVGKELVARQVHELSRRRNGPFVAINCAALVETLLEAELFGIEDRTATGVRGRRGKFEHADGGTLFLDEVSDLSLSAQAKLLRAIQDLAVERVGGSGTHRVDIRIVAATNRSLLGLVERRLFRPDLYYRLSGVDIRVPALRERRADIIELARYFLERHRAMRKLRLSAAASDALVAYDWPGNVRELERLIERAVALAGTDVIELDDLPPGVRGDYGTTVMPSLARRDTLRAWGSRYARLVLERAQGNKREACRVLDISYHTLQAYLRYPIGTGGQEEDTEDAEDTKDAEDAEDTDPPSPRLRRVEDTEDTKDTEESHPNKEYRCVEHKHS
jgi:two-component system, NtrC family, response regulator HydG